MKIRAFPYRAAHYFWSILPSSVRGFFYKSPLLKRLKNGSRDLMAKGCDRDDIYNSVYYDYVDSMAARSAAALVSMMMDEFAPKTAIDVGCGTGVLLLELRRRGCNPFGLELSERALEVCRRRGLSVRKLDIERDEFRVDCSYDLVVCMEVAEHVKSAYADKLVDLIVSLGSRVVFTAAVPGQGGGVDHVNEQPNGYWIEKFESRGFLYMNGLTLQRRAQLSEQGVAGFYWENLMLFSR